MVQPPGVDDSVLHRWLRLELSRLNAGIVVERISLARLLREKRPHAKTRDGNVHTFDTEILAQIGSVLSADLQEKLLVPIIFQTDIQVPGSVVLTDPVALQALQELGELSPQRSMRDGKIWIARPIAYALSGKYLTVIQIAVA
jgi:uncharacterized protein (UPF0216 family)